MLAYASAYLFLLHRAFADHSQLSFSHYRLTNCYIRIMVKKESCRAALWRRLCTACLPAWLALCCREGAGLVAPARQAAPPGHALGI